MSQPAAPIPNPIDSAPVPPLGERTTRGFFYALVQFGGSKVVSLSGQVALAWLLGGADFGYIALAFAVSGFGALIANAGIRDVLINRWREFDSWATPAFWMAATLGASSTLLTIAVAPLAAWFFHDQRLTPLIVVLCCQNFFNSLALVPEARLSVNLQFKRLAAVQFSVSTLIIGLSILFAALGFGPYSFILPWPIGAIVRLVILWAAAPQRIAPRPHVRLWKEMAGDNALLVTAAFLLMVTSQFDYVILGRMYTDKTVVGEYFWAFNLSTQALQLLALNLGGVLLPSLAKLQDEPQRQLNALVRACKALTVLTVPACLLQATLANPLMRLIFRPEWHSAIPIVAILSAAWMLMAMNFPATNALKAQGRFAALVWFQAASAAAFLAAVYLGARAGAGVGAAVGVAVHSCIFGPLSVYVASRPLGGTWRDTIDVFLAPVLTGLAAFGLVTVLVWPLSDSAIQHLLGIVLIVLIGCTLYAAAIWFVARSSVDEMIGRLRDLIRRPAAVAEQAPG